MICTLPPLPTALVLAAFVAVGCTGSPAQPDPKPVATPVTATPSPAPTPIPAPPAKPPGTEMCLAIVPDGALSAMFEITKAEVGDTPTWCNLTLEAKQTIRRLRFDYTCFDAEGVKIDDSGETLEDLGVGDKVKSEVLCEEGTTRITMKADR